MQPISHALNGMGGTPDGVAATLRTAGVRGQRNSPSFLNPIVRYLNRTLDIGGTLEIGADGTTIHLLLGGKMTETPLPLPVQVFLDGFHRGLYPDLEVS